MGFGQLPIPWNGIPNLCCLFLFSPVFPVTPQYVHHSSTFKQYRNVYVATFLFVLLLVVLLAVWGILNMTYLCVQGFFFQNEDLNSIQYGQITYQSKLICQAAAWLCGLQCCFVLNEISWKLLDGFPWNTNGHGPHTVTPLVTPCLFCLQHLNNYQMDKLKSGTDIHKLR